MSKLSANLPLPPTWSFVSLREIGVWRGGGTPSKANRAFWTNGTIPWVSPKDMKVKRIADAEDHITAEAVESSATSLINSGSVLIVTRSGILAHTLPVAVSEVDVTLNQDLKAVTPNAEIVPSYVANALDRFEQRILHECTKTGTTVPSIEFPLLLDFEIPLAPLNEQRRIVAEIEKQFVRLDECTAALQRVAEDLKQYRASVLKAACEGRLVPTEAELARAEGRDYEPASALLERILAERRARWEADQLARMKAQGKAPKDDKWKEKYEEPEEPAVGHLMKLPDGWLWAGLGQCFTVERGRFSVRPRNDPRYYGGPYPFVQIGDLPKDGGAITTYSQTLNDKGLNVSKMFSAGTILIAIVGATIANTGVLMFDSCCPDSLVAIHSNEKTLAQYADLYLRSKKLEIRQSSYASGGQPNINLEMLLPYPISVPPLAEQYRIVAEVERRLHIVGELEELVSINLERADELRRSILKRAFEGRLVPQDPNDEPASVLLERIAAERQHRAGINMKKKKSLEPELRSATKISPQSAAPSKLNRLALILSKVEKKAPLLIEDAFRQCDYSFSIDENIDDFFESLTNELKKSSLHLLRGDTGLFLVKR